MKILYYTLEQALLFYPLVVGVYLSYSILKITDLTVDASFVLGAGVYARLCCLQIPPTDALIVALAAGFVAGTVVAIMQRKGKLDPLLTSVIALFMFFSINFNVMGKPNINLQDCITIGSISKNNLFYILLVIAIGLAGFVHILIKSRHGLTLRAFGLNKDLAAKLNKNIELYRMLCLGLSNCLAALSGVLTADINGFADINMGIGVALVAIGSVVIGQQIFNNFSTKFNFNALFDLFKCLIGILIYFLLLNILLLMDINPINLKLILGITLIFFLRFNNKNKSNNTNNNHNNVAHMDANVNKNNIKRINKNNKKNNIYQQSNKLLTRLRILS